MTHKALIFYGSINMLLSVILGAFAAHSLKNFLNEYSMEVFETANFYHFIHSIALILTGIICKQFTLDLSIAGLCFFCGIIIFSGSLYLLSITGFKILGAVTPIGGVLFIIGWSYIAYQFYK